MEHSCTAIVLRRRVGGEADRRLVLLSVEFGKIEAVAKGARKATSRLSAASELLTCSRFLVADGRVNRFIKQAELLHSFRELRTDYHRLEQGLSLCELVDAVCPLDEPAPEVYSLLLRGLDHLGKHPKPVVPFIWMQMRLLVLTGFQPDFNSCVETGGEVPGPRAIVSPTAGGIVSRTMADRYPDGYETTREALIGLSRIAELETPPGNLKQAAECSRVLLPIWKHVAGTKLPTLDQVVKEISRGLEP